MGKGLPEVHIRAGPKIFLVATHTEGTVTLAQHAFIAGFGGGSFQLLKADAPEEDLRVERAERGRREGVRRGGG